MGGVKRWIQNLNSFEKMGYTKEDVESVSDFEFLLYPLSKPINMADSTRLKAIKKLLEAHGNSEEQIASTLGIIREQDKGEQQNSLRSWIAVTTGVVALIASILVAIFK